MLTARGSPSGVGSYTKLTGRHCKFSQDTEMEIPTRPIDPNRRGRLGPTSRSDVVELRALWNHGSLFRDSENYDIFSKACFIERQFS